MNSILIKRMSLMLAALAVVLALPFQAEAQSLQDRIDAVREKRAAQDAAKHALTAEGAILQKLLYSSLSVDFDAVPVSDVFEYLKTVLDINLVIRSSDDLAGHGIDLKTPITLVVDEAPARAILAAVLEECSQLEPCTWQLRAGALEVGTKERLSIASAQFVRVYPIDDLLYEPAKIQGSPSVGIINPGGGSIPQGSGLGGHVGFGRRGWQGGFYRGAYGSAGTAYGVDAFPQPQRQTARDKEDKAQSIVDLIIDTIEPEAWIDNGGDWASITYRDGSLVVRAPDFIHRQINGYPPVPPPARPRPTSTATGG